MDFDTPNDDVTATIDATIDAATEAKTTTAQAETAGDDPAPDSLEARIRLLTPGHTYWTRGDAPSVVRAVAQAFGADVRTAYPICKAVWSTPKGIWMLGFQQCADSDAGAPEYHLSVDFSTDGNGIDIALEGQTPDEVVAVLASLHAIRE